MASLAEQLQRRREGLKEGQTIVVDRSGRRFVEGPGGVLVPVTTNSPAPYHPSIHLSYYLFIYLCLLFILRTAQHQTHLFYFILFYFMN
jgi:hypothetical protein